VGLTTGATLVGSVPAVAATHSHATTAAAAASGAQPVSPSPDVCLYGNCGEQTFCSQSTCVPGPPPACDDGYCIPQTPLCDDGYCVPQTWYVANSLITNGGLDELGAAEPYVNTTTVSQSESEGFTVTGTLTASLNGTFGVSGDSVGGAVAQIQPGATGSVSGSKTVTGTLNVPPDSVGDLYFGIVYDQTSGTVYSLSASGQITTVATNVVATAPVNFGWLGTTEPYTGTA
jgi:hypothetical protein